MLPGRMFTGDAVVPTYSAPCSEAGRPPWGGGKYEPVGVAEGSGAAALLYTG